jgi:hypothetical protein
MKGSGVKSPARLKCFTKNISFTLFWNERLWVQIPSKVKKFYQKYKFQVVRTLSSGMKGCGFKSLGESFQWKVRKFCHKYKFQTYIDYHSISIVVRTLPCGMKGFWFKSIGESLQNKFCSEASEASEVRGQ